MQSLSVEVSIAVMCALCLQMQTHTPEQCVWRPGGDDTWALCCSCIQVLTAAVRLLKHSFTLYYPFIYLFISSCSDFMFDLTSKWRWCSKLLWSRQSLRGRLWEREQTEKCGKWFYLTHLTSVDPAGLLSNACTLFWKSTTKRHKNTVMHI